MPSPLSPGPVLQPPHGEAALPGEREGRRHRARRGPVAASTVGLGEACGNEGPRKVGSPGGGLQGRPLTLGLEPGLLDLRKRVLGSVRSRLRPGRALLPRSGRRGLPR